MNPMKQLSKALNDIFEELNSVQKQNGGSASQPRKPTLHLACIIFILSVCTGQRWNNGPVNDVHAIDGIWTQSGYPGCM